jgi:hypothetical protein
VEPRSDTKRPQNAPRAQTRQRKSKLRIVKLEERIAPKLSANHNQTLVREPGESKPKAPEIGKSPRRLRLRIVKLEERITPTPSIPIPPP